VSLPTSGYTPGDVDYAISISNGLSPLSAGFNFQISVGADLGESVQEQIIGAIEPILSDLVAAVETATGTSDGAVYKYQRGTVDYGNIRTP
jgi:hypothetical protein